jgi:hypothetical protein
MKLPLFFLSKVKTRDEDSLTILRHSDLPPPQLGEKKIIHCKPVQDTGCGAHTLLSSLEDS